MHDELWAGIEFKLGEAQFFLEWMSKVLMPARLNTPGGHPSFAEHSPTQWQPDFYYYLDAFLEAARSVPDIIQKCFGEDKWSQAEWSQPLDVEETARRKGFQSEFTSHYVDFRRLLLSRVRVATFHWLGVPPVQTKARVWLGPEYTGGPLEFIPSAASRQLPPETDPAVGVIAGKPLPVEPSWQDFTLEIPQDDGNTQSTPLFEECRTYLQAAKELVEESKEICGRKHSGGKLTPPPAVRPLRP
jgi:hypothetical protein